MRNAADFVMIGTQLDRYSIVEELGHGGMSTVYRGLDTALERVVAVKVLHDHLAKSSDNRLRFHREAKAIAKLRQNNILEIYDYSAADAAKSYIVMEYVQGKNLREWTDVYNSMPPEYVCAMALEICDALSHAHQHGVIHRDLKPENVMVSDSGQVKLMDFGIAHVVGQETMTQTGSLLGSPAHMAPELIEGERADIRSDIFSFGTVLYWLAAARLPFDGNNAPQVFKKVLNNEIVDLELVDAKIGSRFADLLRKCMQRLPEDRFQTVDELQSALERYLATTGLVQQETLVEFLDDPGKETERFEAQIVGSLVACARDAYETRDIPRAVALFNRVLAYDPENPDVKEMMAALGRRRFARASAVGGVVAALAVAGIITVLNAPTDPTDPKEETLVDTAPALKAVSVSAENASNVAKTSEISVVVAKYIAQHSREVFDPTPEIANNKNNAVAVKETDTSAVATNNAQSTNNKQTTAPMFRYRFSVIPAAATFLLDGRPIDVLVARNGVELTEGIHRVSATSPGAKPFVRNIRVEGIQQKIQPIVMEWLNGRVQVVSNTKAVVWLSGDPKMKPIDARGKNATFFIPFGRADTTPTQKEVVLRIASAQDMGHPETHKISVKPGQLTTLNVSFSTNE